MKNFTLRQVLGSAASIVAVLAFGTAGAAESANYKWPKLLVIGTPGTASGGFASTNGWAPVLQQDGGPNVRVIPEDSELMRYRRLTDQRNIQVSSVSAAEMRFQIQGIGGYAASKPVPQRTLWHHNDSPWGFVVPGDSSLRSLEDLKKGGVRIAQGMFSPPMIAAVTRALPAFLGLSEEEAKKTLRYVPVSSYAENCRSVVEGKADVAYCSTISSVLSEMEGAPGGIRWLPMPHADKEGWSRFLEHRPMLVPTTIDLGVATARGLESTTSNFVYAVPADADVDFAYNMAKWFHTAHDDYKSKHPLAERMSLEQFRSYLDRSPIPVHEGTVKYLREIGAWTEKDDAWNNEAIAKMDKWIAARQAAMDEAQKSKVKIDFQNDEFLKILDKHTDGLEGFKSRL